MIWLLGLALLLPQQEFETLALMEQLALAQRRHDERTIQASLLELTDRLGMADLESLRIVVPEILRASDDPDAQTRELAMLALTAIKGDGLAVLRPYTGSIARHLHDASLPARQVTVLVLGEFQGHPTATVIDPLLESLKEADAPKTIGPGVVYALLTLGVDDPLHPEIAEGILRFVRRPMCWDTRKPSFLSQLRMRRCIARLWIRGCWIFLVRPTQLRRGVRWWGFYPGCV